MGIDRALLYYAQKQHIKSALVPSDQAAGGPPPDPAQAAAGGGAPPGGGGGMPPGMPPGMDPAMLMAAAGGGGGGMPPPDPSQMGGAPPPGGGGGGGNDLTMAIQTAVNNALAQSGIGPGGAGAGGGGGAGGGPGAKGAKPDIHTVATDLFQLKKMIFGLFRAQGLELPPDVLDGPNRHPMTGAPSASPTGGSEVGGVGGGAQQPQSAISPVEPMQAAFPGPPGGGGGGGGEQPPTGAPAGKQASFSGMGEPIGLPSHHALKPGAHARAVAQMLTKRRARTEGV